MKRKLAYIAGPLFTPAERKYLEEIEKAVSECGYETYLPHRDAGLFLAGINESKKFFDKDSEKIKESNVVIAVLNGADVDSGTAWEIGFAYSNGIKIFGILDDTRKISVNALNPMIVNSMTKIVKNVEELKQNLKDSII